MSRALVASLALILVVPSCAESSAVAPKSPSTTVPAATAPGTGARGALPGRCEDPEAEIARRSEGGGLPPGDGPDLDGDGTPDIIHRVGATNTTSDLLLFVRRGACAHFVGALSTTAVGLHTLSTRAHGLLDLEGEEACQVDCCPNGARFVFRFDGERYALASRTPTTRTCAAPPGVP